MENLIANVTVNGVENQVELQPIIIRKSNVINIIYNCITLKDFQQVLHMNTNRLFNDLSVENASQIDANFINIFIIEANGDMYRVHSEPCSKLYDTTSLKHRMFKGVLDYIMAGYCE